MKYRPLCTTYRADALSRLEEVSIAVTCPHELVIEAPSEETFLQASSSSESEREQQTPPPRPRPRAKGRKRPLVPLDDDASFEFIKRQDSMDEATSEKSEDKENGSAEKRRGAKGSPHLPDKGPTDAKTVAVKDVMVEDEIFSVESSSYEGGAVVAQPSLHLVTKVPKLKKRPIRPVPAMKRPIARHPLEDTDDELSGADESGSSKERLAEKPLLPSTVDVSLSRHPTSQLNSQSQHSDAYESNDECDPLSTMKQSDMVVSHVVTKDNDAQVEETEFECEMVIADSPSNDAFETDTDVIMTDFVEVSTSRSPHQANGGPSTNFVASADANHSVLHKARANFWLSDTRHEATATSSQSFFDIVYGDEGRMHYTRLVQLRSTSTTENLPPREQQQRSSQDKGHKSSEALETESHTSPPLEEQHRDDGGALEVVQCSKESAANDASFTSVPAKTDSPLPGSGTPVSSQAEPRFTVAESRALVPVRPSATIPPIWFDVVKVIMFFLQNNRAGLLPFETCQRSQNVVENDNKSNDCKGQTAVLPSKDEETPRLKSTNEASAAPLVSSRVVSDEKPKKQVPTNGTERLQEKQGKKRRPRTEQEKLERREKKRQKRERRERKRQKKADRRERKRKARENGNATVSEHKEPSVERPSDVVDINGKEKRRKMDKGRDSVRQRNGTGFSSTITQPSSSAAEHLPGRQPPVSEQQLIHVTHSKTTQSELGPSHSENPTSVSRDNISDKPPALFVERKVGSNRRASRNLAPADVDADESNNRTGKKHRKKEMEGHSSATKVAPVTAATTTKGVAGAVANGLRARKDTKNSRTSKETTIGNDDYRRVKAGDRPNPPNASHDASNRVDRPMATDSTHMTRQEEAEVPSLRALCSESFFEEWSETVALLASGQWFSFCQSQQTADDTPPRLGPTIQLFDTPLLEDSGVDIELPGHAIIIYRLSAWATRENAANICAKYLVRLAALEMYKDIDVIICADVDISSTLSAEIAFLQNAVLTQSGINSSSPSFQVTAPHLVAPVVASRVMSTRSQRIATDRFINAAISDVRVQERALFLRALSPSLSACGALLCIICLREHEDQQDDFTSQAFQRLIKGAVIDGNLFESETLFEMHASALCQLSIVLRVPLSDD